MYYVTYNQIIFIYFINSFILTISLTLLKMTIYLVDYDNILFLNHEYFFLNNKICINLE